MPKVAIHGKSLRDPWYIHVTFRSTVHSQAVLTPSSDKMRIWPTQIVGVALGFNSFNVVGLENP